MSNADPVPSDSATPVASADSPNPAPLSRETRWVVGLAFALVLGPLLYYAGRREIAKWYQAASHTHLYAGNHQDAFHLNETAREWNAQSYSIWRDCVSLNMAMRDHEAAVQSSERLLELARAAYERRQSSVNQSNLAEALNNCAYSLALNNATTVNAAEIKRGLELVNESLDLAVEGANVLDTRGYLTYLAGDNEQAIADTEKAVALMERTYKRQLHQIREQSRGFVDRSRFEYYQAQINEAMAVLLYHRGLAYQRAKPDAAQRDFLRAKALGFDPAEGLL